MSEFDPDVLLVEGGSNLLNSLMVVAWAKIRRKPVVWWTLGELPGRRYTAVGRLMRKLIGIVERSCAALLLYSTQGLDYAVRIGVDRSRCFVAVNVIDTLAAERSAAEAVRRKSEVGPKFDACGHPTIVFVGALVPQKSLELLPSILSALRQKGNSSRLLIIGDGPLAALLEMQFASLGLSDSVIFAGEQRKDLSDWLVCADVGLLPGLGGLAISELMAHGLPVICNGGDGTDVDLIQNGKTGYNVRGAANPVQEMASYLHLLTSDLKCAQAMGVAARELVTREMSGEAMVQVMCDAVRYAARQGK
ncbi:glycosyltransferase [Novilysobacter antarcticus]|uniref:glycosyltransferase n=1 Tax=Novilysobacter antarcticus TaxID=2862543 RepID=UPI001C997C43|nr:glycosyltransferase [Lysobacter antarcticus]